MHATATYAQRTLTAGRPGSWEADAIMDVVYFGNGPNLHFRKGKSTVEEIRAANPQRVHLKARDQIAAVLRTWTGSAERYTEVPETLAGLIGAYADERHGANEWRAIADQWIQPNSLDKKNFVGTNRLLYSTSSHFNPNSIVA